METIHMLPSDDEVDALVLGKTGVFFTVAFSHELSPTDDDLQREWHVVQLGVVGHADAVPLFISS